MATKDTKDTSQTPEDGKGKNASFLMNLSKLSKKWGKKSVEDIADEARDLSIALQSMENQEQASAEAAVLAEVDVLKPLELDPALAAGMELPQLLSNDEQLAQAKRVSQHRAIETEKLSEKPATEDGAKSQSTATKTKEATEEQKEKAPAPKPPKNAEVYLSLTGGNMRACIKVTAPENGGQDVTKEQIMNLLKSRNVVFGIQESAIDAFVAKPKYGVETVVALGVEPVNGVHGSIENVFEISTANTPALRPDGTMDYKELGIITNIEAGAVICLIHYPTTGTPGKTVLGADVQQQVGKEAPSPQGRNTEITEDGQRLVATSGGSISYSSGKYTVSEVFKVNGNVDTSTGNINFLGSVFITGDVKEGFSVIATDEIRISGMVEGAYIRSGSSVKIQNGVNGMGKGTIIANGDVKCKFLESCKVQAFGNVYAESIIASNIKCDGEIVSTAGKGVIMSGEYVVAKGVSAKIIGSNSNIPTTFTLGVTVSLNDKIAAIRHDIQTSTEDIRKLAQIATYLAEIAKKNQLDSEKLAMYNNAVYSHNIKLKELEKLNNTIVELESQLTDDTSCYLQAKSCIYPGVVINISNFTYRVKNELVKPLIYLTQEGITATEGGAR